MKFRIKESVGKSGTTYYEPQIHEFLWWWRSFSEWGNFAFITKEIDILGPIRLIHKEAAQKIIEKYIKQQEIIKDQKERLKQSTKKKHKTIFHGVTTND